MPDALRLLVTGARVVTPAETVFIEVRLDRLTYPIRSAGRPVIIVQGECPQGGVDLVAERWAGRTEGVTSEGHPADWEQFGRKAGPIRNSHMVSLGANMVAAFPVAGSRGTWDCLQKAVAAGIEPRLWPLHIYVGANDHA